MSNFAYFYGTETEQYQFYRMPRVLFTNKRFKDLSCMAKVLYGFLLDRTVLSLKSDWRDNNRIYVFFTLEEAMEMLGIGHNKAVKIFSELENIGLIIRKKQGQGKPTKIFVMNFAKDFSSVESESKANDEEQTSNSSDSDFQTSQNRKSENNLEKEEEVKTSEKRKSALPKSGGQDFRKKDTIKTDMNKTDMNQTNQSIYQGETETEPRLRKSENDRWSDEGISECRENIKNQIGYDALVRRINSPNTAENPGLPVETLDLIVDIILEAYNPRIETLTINGLAIPCVSVRHQYCRIDESHIEYIADCMQESAKTRKIKNLRSYLRTCLYNAPHTMEQYYANEVEYDTHNY